MPSGTLEQGGMQRELKGLVVMSLLPVTHSLARQWRERSIQQGDMACVAVLLRWQSACKILDNFTILAPSAFLISQEMDSLLAMPLQAFPFIKTQLGSAVVSNSAIEDTACRS